MSFQTYQHKKPLKLESGKKIKNLEIGYHTFGTLNEDKSNVVWVCHALTANADVMDWWPGLFGPKELFNPDKYFIICANILGSPYGTTNPLSINADTGLPYYLSFPQFTVRDMVAVHQLLSTHLKINQIKVLIGGSLGGQQAMEWAISDPLKIDQLILISTNAKHSSWGIAFNESQRMAIAADRTFYANKPDGGSKGLRAARSIALLSYRGYKTYQLSQQDDNAQKIDEYKASSYQQYQGDKLLKRFNAYSYWYLSKAMDSHHIGRKRTSLADALAEITAKTLVIGINCDLLFPVEEQKFLERYINGAKFEAIQSIYGHDGFLIETETLTKIIGEFLDDNEASLTKRSLKIIA